MKLTFWQFWWKPQIISLIWTTSVEIYNLEIKNELNQNFSLCLLFKEKYEDENENSSEKINNNNNETTTIVASTGNSTQPQQIFHVQVEYEEPKLKVVKTEVSQNARKRRQVTKDGNDISQQQFAQQYQPAASTPKQMPTIIIDDKSQDTEMKIQEVDTMEHPAKHSRIDESQKLDKFEVFGMFVANEMRSLQSLSLQNKLKRKILECILEMNDQDSDQHWKSVFC